MVVKLLLGGLVVLGLAYAIALIRVALARGQLRPGLESIALGAVTNFFDTLGIGSYAPTTAWLKLRKMVPDSFIPVILNAGHGLPTIVQALIFIKLVQVDPMLLAFCPPRWPERLSARRSSCVCRFVSFRPSLAWRC